VNERQSSDKPSWSTEVVQPALAAPSARWVLPILRALEGGPLRRNALRQQLGPVSDKILTETLRRMEANQRLCCVDRVGPPGTLNR
jgi:DNA-binding HxlR family transcriptional regulator